VTEAETNKQLQAIRFEAEDLNEAAELVSVEFRIAERDHAIISDKLASVEKWQANDEIRHVVLGMITAVTDAAYCEDAPDEEGNGHEAQPLKGLIHLSKDRARRR
jgi:hypothetical protein